MARLEAPRRRSLFVRISEAVSRRMVGKKLGARASDPVAPMTVLEHNPKIMSGFGAFEYFLDRSRALPERLALLARERVSPLVGCPW